MEELTENAEEPDDGDSKKEEQKLGKLQYKVRYKILVIGHDGGWRPNGRGMVYFVT